MTRYQDERLQELIKSSYADPESIFIKKVQKVLSGKVYKIRWIETKSLTMAGFRLRAWDP
jgi:hypothetical protein